MNNNSANLLLILAQCIHFISDFDWSPNMEYETYDTDDANMTIA